jgi:hypothetical protein
LGHRLIKSRPRINGIDETPLNGAFPTYTLNQGTKEISDVTPHLPFIDKSRKATRSRQHAQQRRFG